LTVVLVLAPLLAFGQAEPAVEAGGVEAIQRRTYELANEIDLTVGVLPGDPYTKGLIAGGGYVFHFTDHFAWNVAHAGYSYDVTTSLRDQLTRDFGAPSSAFEQPQFFVGSDVIFKPFYGKSSVVNQYVVHFDAQIVVGVNVWKYQVGGFAPAVNFGAGVRVFQNHVMSWRLDVTDDVVIFAKKAPINVPTLSLSLAFNFGATE
jgi:outer membrane beta-barrel protein